MDITRDKLDEIHALTERAHDLLEGQDSDAICAVVTDLMAWWIAGHTSQLGERQTAQLHRRLLHMSIKSVEKLIRYYRER